MSSSKRHHYTPRYYLKRFENEHGQMWRLDKESGDVTPGSNVGFGLKNHWNRLRSPPEGYESDWAEKRLSEVDGFAAILVQRILAGEFPSDLRALAYAISFMQNNQPRLMRELEDNHRDEIENWSDDWRLIVRMKTALENGMSYVPVYYSVQVIDENEPDLRFLTSSNPLIEFSNKPTSLLPLSSRHCLFLSYDQQFEEATPRLMTCDRQTVEGINRRTMENAWQYVYSCKPDFSH